MEYNDHVSQSVFVKFPVIGRENTFVVIWTTTPWTLPANLAVAYNKEFQYVSAKVDGDSYIVFCGLLPAVAEKCGWQNYTETPFPTAELDQLEYRHPFIPARKGRAYAADFVTADTGTGFVHIAPGHGQDDYKLGLQVGLPIYSPVDDDGKFALTNDLPVEQQMPGEMVGKSILEKHGKSDANEAVLHELRTRHALLHQENYHHSYPHCWRSKTPIIFRAMDQWFIEIDHDQFRDRALGEIDRVAWIPDWGVNRIKGAVQSRPDWCISRQRSWGVPLPAFYDATGEAILNKEVICNVAKLIEQHGSNVWFEKSAAELWSLAKPANWQGSDAVAKSNDTLDVWIDSGSSRSVFMPRSHRAYGRKSPGKKRRFKQTCIWKAPTNIAAGSSRRCCFRWQAMAPRHSRRCSRMASWWMPTAKKSPKANRAPTKNLRPPKPTSRNGARTWCASGSPPRISAATSS